MRWSLMPEGAWNVGNAGQAGQFPKMKETVQSGGGSGCVAKRQCWMVGVLTTICRLACAATMHTRSKSKSLLTFFALLCCSGWSGFNLLHSTSSSVIGQPLLNLRIACCCNLALLLPMQAVWLLELRPCGRPPFTSSITRWTVSAFQASTACCLLFETNLA